jgi:methylmalonyl-CoA mutase cobalamin-binding subunit
MHFDMQNGTVRRASGAAGGVSQFAAEVVARLVARDVSPDATLRDDLVDRLLTAASSGDFASFETLKPELKRARVSATVLADHYIPEVARRLGEAWMQDCASFAQVTMGVSRLQAILREIGVQWAADASGTAVGPTLLLILPHGEQHSLGAMVLAGRLRRLGLSVCLRIAPEGAELVSLLAARRFDGALISIACEDKLETCRKLVETIRHASGGRISVVVGGALLERCDTIVDLTGADAATNDIDRALSALGLSERQAAMLEPA